MLVVGGHELSSKFEDGERGLFVLATKTGWMVLLSTARVERCWVLLGRDRGTVLMDAKSSLDERCTIGAA